MKFLKHIEEFLQDIETPSVTTYFVDIIELVVVAVLFVLLVNVINYLWSLCLLKLFGKIGY